MRMTGIIKQLSAAADPKLFEPMLSGEDVAESLGLHPKTVLAMARDGKIPAFRIGKYWRFRASQIDEWVLRSQAANHARA